MPTTGVINGTKLRIYVEGAVVGRATTCSLNVSREMREILDKDNTGGGWVEYAPGRKSGTMSTDVLMSYDTANETAMDIFGYLNAGTAVTLRFTTEVAGDTYWEAEAFCNSISMNAPVEDNVTYTAEFTISGAVTTGTEA